MGGLDKYILNTSDKKLQSDKAQELRARLLKRAEEIYEQERTLAQQAGIDVDAVPPGEAGQEELSSAAIATGGASDAQP